MVAWSNLGYLIVMVAVIIQNYVLCISIHDSWTVQTLSIPEFRIAVGPRRIWHCCIVIVRLHAHTYTLQDTNREIIAITWSILLFHLSPAGWTLDGSSCHSQCKTGEFWSGTECTKCAVSCLECSGPSDGECISCKTSQFLETLSNRCLSQCPSGFYGDTETTQCKPCSLGCQQCSGSTVCQACLSGSVLYRNTCVAQCPAGTYQTKDNKCEPCSESCLECKVSPSRCTKCRVEDILKDGQCSRICPKGAFMNRDTKECFECHPHCAECTGPSVSECTQCEAPATKVGSTCVTPCPAGSYYDSDVHQCQPCNYYCQTCVGGEPECSDKLISRRKQTKKWTKTVFEKGIILCCTFTMNFGCSCWCHWCGSLLQESSQTTTAVPTK